MNELNFLDLAILRKVDAESTVEKFGSMINTSFFETANLLGTIKIKGYINIVPSVGGVSSVTLTDAGNSLLAFAEQKANEPIEPLDNAILHALAGGARELDALQHALNIRGADLAYHINKLVKQGFMDYEIRSAKVYFVLTEMGFNATGGVRVQQKLDAPSQGLRGDAGAAPAQAESKGDASPVAQAVSELKKEEAAVLQPEKKEGAASAPPWVDPATVKPSSEKSAMKEDVAHIISERIHIPRPEDKAHKPKKRELTPEEIKRREKTSRFFSKVSHYVVEYAPYIVLIAMVLAIFAGAIFLSLTKLA